MKVLALVAGSSSLLPLIPTLSAASHTTSLVFINVYYLCRFLHKQVFSDNSFLFILFILGSSWKTRKTWWERNRRRTGIKSFICNCITKSNPLKFIWFLFTLLMPINHHGRWPLLVSTPVWYIMKKESVAIYLYAFKLDNHLHFALIIIWFNDSFPYYRVLVDSPELLVSLDSKALE